MFDQIKNDQGVVLATWIGFHDLQQQDSWQWVDGSDNTYTLVFFNNSLLRNTSKIYPKDRNNFS